MRLNIVAAAAVTLVVGSCGTHSSGDNQAKPGSAVTATCPGGEPTAEEYAVLSAVIQGLYGEGAQRFVVTSEMATANGEAISSDPKAPVDKGALDDLMKKNAAPSCTKASFTLGKPVEMIAEADANAFFKDGPEAGWKAFDAKYPGAQGILKISRVGFSADGATAVLFVQNAKAALNAEGVVVVAQKQGGAWTVQSRRVLWIA